jgi:nicotinic acetylcholine receptor
MVNLIFPCVLISFMTVLGFSLPPDSGEKIGLEITTLLSIVMFSQLITNKIPESSLSIPKIGSINFVDLKFAGILCVNLI